MILVICFQFLTSFSTIRIVTTLPVPSLKFDTVVPSNSLSRYNSPLRQLILCLQTLQVEIENKRSSVEKFEDVGQSLLAVTSHQHIETYVSQVSNRYKALQGIVKVKTLFAFIVLMLSW